MAKREPPSSAANLIPERPTLQRLREVAAACQACDLYQSASQTVFGEGPFRSQRRGELVTSPYAPSALATVHPSSILRAQDDEARHEAEGRFVEDLKKIPK